MTPDELRSLADEGPWVALTMPAERGGTKTVIWTVDGAIVAACTEPDARLIALAPDLARLCAELGEALEFYGDEATYTQMTSWGGRIIDDEGPWINDVGTKARIALARLSELETT